MRQILKPTVSLMRTTFTSKNTYNIQVAGNSCAQLIPRQVARVGRMNRPKFCLLENTNEQFKTKNLEEERSDICIL